jgi:hypothetical protein
MSLLLCPRACHSAQGCADGCPPGQWRRATRRPGGQDARLPRARAPGSDVARKITWLLFRASDGARTAGRRPGLVVLGGLFYARIAVFERGCGDFGRLTPATGVARSGGGPPRALV